MPQLISGRWTYDREDHLVFRIKFTINGKMRRADARSSFSHDIAEAMSASHP